jgi:hypothetical protein
MQLHHLFLEPFIRFQLHDRLIAPVFTWNPGSLQKMSSHLQGLETPSSLYAEQNGTQGDNSVCATIFSKREAIGLAIRLIGSPAKE